MMSERDDMGLSFRDVRFAVRDTRNKGCTVYVPYGAVNEMLVRTDAAIERLKNGLPIDPEELVSLLEKTRDVSAQILADLTFWN
jgi:hypothetical protein